MGAATLGQAASDAVIVFLRRPLTWASAVTWPFRLAARSVRIEVIRGPGDSTRLPAAGTAEPADKGELVGAEAV